MMIAFSRALLLLPVSVLLGLAAHAQLPGGRYQGSVSNNPFNEWCRITDATIEFMDAGQGRFQMTWQEEGFSPSGGFCSSSRDGLLVPTERKGEWNVNFQDFNLSLGRALFDPQTRTLKIIASYSTLNTGFNTLEGSFQFQDEGSRILYSRMIGRAAASTLFANGNLYRR
jgi:hypothetical protein